MSEISDNFAEFNVSSSTSSPDYYQNSYSDDDDNSVSQDYYYLPPYLLPPYIQVDGVYECNANGQNATVQSIFQCFLYRLPFWLETGGIGFLCWGLLLPVVLISIFGKFKEQYRWFILNQAIWDIFMTYDFQCDKPSHYWFQGLTEDLQVLFNQGPANCYYHIYDGNLNIVKTFHEKLLKFVQFSPLFLLTFSRFICLYFHHFYHRNSSTKKIIFFILIFNVFFMFLVTIRTTYAGIINENVRNRDNDDTYRMCHLTNCQRLPIPYCNQTDIDICTSKIPFLDPFWSSFLSVFEYAIPSITLILSNIFSIAMMIKVGKQLKFQATQRNSASLNSTIRITVICFIQTLTITLMFIFVFVQNLREIGEYTFNIGEYGIEKLYKEMVPLLFEASAIRSFNQIRIFIDNIIILLVLNGYRKSLRNFFLTIFKILKNPTKILNIRELTSLSVSSTKITVISKSSHHTRKFK